MFDNKMKYIMINHNRPVLFLDTWDHDRVAKAMCSLEHGDKVTSAGFVVITCNKEVRCYGRSHSLRMQTNDNDTMWVSKALGLEQDEE